MKILYDASILAVNYKKDANRSGIFWTAYNILKEVSENSTFDIILYISVDHKEIFSNIKNIKKDKFLKKFAFIIDYDMLVTICRKKIKENIQKIKRGFNILRKILYILRLTKNYISLFIYTMHNNKRKNNFYKRADIFFSPMFAISDKIYQYKSMKKYLILYDVIPLKFSQYFSVINKWFLDVVETLNKNTYYFCISEHTKHDFLKTFPDKLDNDKMFVIPLASSQHFRPQYNREILYCILKKYGAFLENGRYIFSLCTLAPHKNLIFTISCFIKFIDKHAIHDLYFYLAGAQAGNFNATLENRIPHFKEYRNKIIKLGYVDDEDVNILYSNSLFFTFISQYEGFGIPPLEAMAAGTPVITSNNSSLPEVVGEAAITIDCDNEDQCIRAFEDLYFNEDLRQSYIQRGLERAKLFSWEKTARMICDAMLQHNNIQRTGGEL